jgi:hypothetical protein
MSISQGRSHSQSGPSLPPLLPNIADMSRSELDVAPVLPPITFAAPTSSRSLSLSYLDASGGGSATGDGDSGSAHPLPSPAASRSGAAVTADSSPRPSSRHMEQPYPEATQPGHAESRRRERRARRPRPAVRGVPNPGYHAMDEDVVQSVAPSSAHYSSSLLSVTSPAGAMKPAASNAAWPRNGVLPVGTTDDIAYGQLRPPQGQPGATGQFDGGTRERVDATRPRDGPYPVSYAYPTGVMANASAGGVAVPYYPTASAAVGVHGYGAPHVDVAGHERTQPPAGRDIYRGGLEAGPAGVQYSVGSAMTAASPMPAGSPMPETARPPYAPIHYYGSSPVGVAGHGASAPVPAAVDVGHENVTVPGQHAGPGSGYGHVPGGAGDVGSGRRHTMVPEGGMYGSGGGGGVPYGHMAAVSLGSRQCGSDAVASLARAATVDEIRAAKRMLRKVKNREAAARSNQRRKVRDDALKADVSSIRERVHHLRNHAESLRVENGRLRGLLSAALQRQTQGAQAQLGSVQSPQPVVLPGMGKMLQ